MAGSGRARQNGTRTRTGHSYRPIGYVFQICKKRYMIQFRSSCGSSALINYLVLRIPCGKVCKFFRVWFADKDYLEPQLAITRPACLLENFVFCEYDIASRLHIRPIAKYSDFGPIDGYISETVQDRR